MSLQCVFSVCVPSFSNFQSSKFSFLFPVHNSVQPQFVARLFDTAKACILKISIFFHYFPLLQRIHNCYYPLNRQSSCDVCTLLSTCSFNPSGAWMLSLYLVHTICLPAAEFYFRFIPSISVETPYLGPLKLTRIGPFQLNLLPTSVDLHGPSYPSMYNPNNCLS